MIQLIIPHHDPTPQSNCMILLNIPTPRSHSTIQLHDLTAWSNSTIQLYDPTPWSPLHNPTPRSHSMIPQLLSLLLVTKVVKSSYTHPPHIPNHKPITFTSDLILNYFISTFSLDSITFILWKIPRTVTSDILNSRTAILAKTCSICYWNYYLNLHSKYHDYVICNMQLWSLIYYADMN